MNSQIKQRWIDALRSGKYSQDTGVLRSSKGGHCCLGVLCDLYAKEHNVQWDVHRYNSDLDEHFDIPEDEVSKVYLFDEFRFNGELEILPDNVKIWAGLNNLNPCVYSDGIDNVGNQLSEMNDTGASFNEIADLIEKYIVA
jgi:hypothetical protein